MNILSEGRLLELGCEISKSATMAVISRNGIAMLKASPAGRLMFVNQAYSNSASMCATLSSMLDNQCHAPISSAVMIFRYSKISMQS